MSRLPADSVGLVTPQRHTFTEPLSLACGKQLPRYELVYETYGELNASASNAVLICHALSGHHHAAITASMNASPAGGITASAPARRSIPTAFLWSA